MLVSISESAGTINTPIISYKQQSDLATRLRFLALLVSVA